MIKRLLWLLVPLALIASSENGALELAYGKDEKQRLDYWHPRLATRSTKATKSPLIIFIHGGGWAIGDKATGGRGKPSFYKGMGYAFASLNYRLVPKVTPDDQAKDIASAIADLRGQSRSLGFDPNRIILMGHSAGAHLAALVSANTRYLESAGVPLSSIKGTILLDGAGYDVPKQMASKQNRLPDMYVSAFTNDKPTQVRLSPITHARAPNSPRWLILHVAARPDSAAQSNMLGKALSASGAFVAVKAIPNSSHMSINRDAGAAGTVVGNEIADFLERLH